MKTIIEFFKWDFEGEYQQYFYVIEEEDKEKFLKEALEYLNTVTINSDYSWHACLSGFHDTLRVDVDFIHQVYLQHLNEYYYIQDDDVKFSLSKVSWNYCSEGVNFDN